jgi:LCP family protein required for cell wall assembly
MSVANPAEQAEAGAGTRGPGRRRGRRVAKIVLLSVAVLLTIVLSGVYLTSERLANQIHRYGGVFAGLDEQARPSATDATTFLFVGSDSLSPNRPAGDVALDGSAGGQPSDVIMLVRIEPGYRGATAVSLPGESLVNVPGRGTTKLDASYSLGGPSLLVRTVEDITRLRIDHFASIDYAGLRALTDTVGGIEVDITGRTSSGGVISHPGRNHLDGTQVLAYLRQYDDVSGGELDRVRRQQNALRALLVKASEHDLLANPVRAYQFFDTLTRWVGVDDTLGNGDLRTMVWRLRALSPGGITFLTAPVTTSRADDTGSPALRLDTKLGAELWQAVGAGDPGRYLKKHPADSLGSVSP